MVRLRASLVIGVAFVAAACTLGQPREPRLTTLPGFTVERAVPVAKTDSYVAMTFDSLGRLVVSKEQDHPRILLDGDGDGILESERVFSDRVENCQGLWFEGRTLYGVCAPADTQAQGPDDSESGLYRMEDTDGDDVADTFEQISTFQSGIQEHGPHAIRRGPDGAPWLMIGNNTFVPDDRIDPMSPLRDFRESQLLPALPDGRGFGNSTKEGAHGTIVRLDRDNNQYTLVTGGFRNAYDLAFNLAGEMFTFDSDMEWDINLPWFREVRSVHAVPGGNYGYRDGSGKFPPYYLDSLPPMHDLGRGSPVGVEFYQHHAYPVEFHDAYFEGDWSRGRLLYTALERDGATYSARADAAEFVHGEPLNITDVEVGPDGMVYFVLGGRATGGGVYRVRYTGAAPAEPHAEGILAVVRQPQPLSSWGWAALEEMKASMGVAWGSELEQLARDRDVNGEDSAQAVYMLQRHGPQPSADLLGELITDTDAQVRAAVVFVAGLQSGDAAWTLVTAALGDGDALVRRRAAEALVRMGLAADLPSLAPVADIYGLLYDDDRFVRYAGRVALERTPRAEWADAVLSDTDALRAIEGMVALINTAGSPRDLAPVFEKQLGLMQKSDLSVDDRLRLLRAFQLAAIEAGDSVQPELRQRVHGLLIGQFPTRDERLNRELALTLAYCGQPEAIGRILAAMPTGARKSAAADPLCVRPA